MKIAKKTLSVFLSVLMLITSCSVGIFGITVFAADVPALFDTDGSYTADEVKALLKTAASEYNGNGLSNEDNKLAYEGSYSMILAADAVVSYGMQTCVSSYGGRVSYNTGVTVAEKLISDLAITDGTQQAIVKAIFDPSGDTTFSYLGSLPKPTSDTCDSSKYAWHSGSQVASSVSVGECTNNSIVKWDTDSGENLDSCKENLSKSSTISLSDEGLSAYILQYDSIEDIPDEIITKVRFSFDYAREKYAYCYQKGALRNAYTSKYVAFYWNYFSNVESKITGKNKKVKKQLTKMAKLFNEEVTALTLEEMLTYDAATLESLYTFAKADLADMEDSGYSIAVLKKFCNYDAGVQYVKDLYFAYRVVLGMDSIDAILDNPIITDGVKNYNPTVYKEMAPLYTKVNTAYNVVKNIDTDILNYIKTEYAGYDEKYASLDLAKTKSDLDTLYADMRLQLLKDTYASVYDTYVDYYDLVKDENNLEDIETIELIGLNQKVNGYNATLATYDRSSIDVVFPEGHYEAWQDFCTQLAEKLEVRNVEIDFETYYEYYIPLLFSNYAGLDNEEVMDMYDGFEDNLQALKDAYTEYSTTYDADTIKDIFTIYYNGKDQLLQDAVTADLLPALQQNIIDRNNEQLETIKGLAGLTVIDFNNYDDVKAILSAFDQDLYDFVVSHGWITTDAEAIYNNIASYKALYDAFVATGGKSAFTSNIDADGIYAVREAGDQTELDEDGYEVQIGYPNDIARDNEDNDNDGVVDDNYTVSRDEMEETIVKIDNFIVDRDFGALVGLTDEETGEFTTLGATIESLFENLLFTPDIINMLMSVFPMLCGLLEDMLPQLIYDNCGELDPVDPNASARVDLSSLGVSNLEGLLDIYLNTDKYNGTQKQIDLKTATEELGLYIYPGSMADILWDVGVLSKRDDVYIALKNAGNNWKAFEGYDAAEETYTFDYEWDVYDYESFITVVGGILDCIGPLLPTVFLDQDYSGKAAEAGYGYGSLKYGILSLGSGNGAFGDLTVDVKALNLYAELFIPLFEALGIGSQGFIDYTYPTLTTESEGVDYAAAIFDPIMALLDAVVAAPLETVLELLPNLIYFLSMDFIDSYLQNDFLLDITVGLIISGGDDGMAQIVNILGDLLSFDLYSDTLTFADFGLGNSMYDVLGFEITSLNAILEYVLGMLDLGFELDLPEINQEELIFASKWTEYTSANGTQRVYLDADPVQVLYVILNYVIKAIGQPGFLDGLLGDSLDANLQLLINQIVANVSYHKDDALAAIMEILVPNTDANGEPEYELEEMDWVTPGEFNYGEIEGASQMSIVYLNYGNDWTKEDSQYIIENSDEIVATILEMTGSDIESLNAMLADMVNGIFTNDVITDLVEMLGGLGDSPSGIILDIFTEQLGVDISVWFNAFGYLYSADTWADDAVIVAPGDKNYSTTFTNVTATADTEGNITWYYDGEAFEDGDKQMFIDILCELAAEFDIVISFLLGGGDVGVFNNLVELKGYESYATTLGLLLETLGVKNLPTQAQFSADPMGGLKTTLTAVANWFDSLVNSDNMIEIVLEIIPDLFYYIESNGLGTLVHNLLMPVLVLVDDVRPLLDVNINYMLSLIVSEFLNYGTLDMNVVIQGLTGAYMPEDPDYKWYSINIDNLTLSEILKIADVYLGTDLYNSGLVQIGVKGLCSGVESYDSVVGTGYRTTVDAADTLTILLTAVIDCLSYPAQDESKTNGDVILEFIAELTENDDIAGLYDTIAEVLKGIELEYTQPNWGYMFPEGDVFTTTLPEHTIVYLGYNTDWDQETADGVYDALDEILEIVLDSTLEEGETLKTLIDGLLEGEVYTDEILNTLVELIVNAIAGFDKTLLDLVDCVVSTDLGAWFTFCEEQTTDVTDEETGEVTTETKWVCTYDWKIDEQTTTEAKKNAFIDAIGEVLEPANELLAWLFFGDSYAFFTSSEVDDEGNYTYADLITLNGGEGYARGLVPILEALGCTMQPAENFAVTDEDGNVTGYDVGAAVGGILDSVLALVDDICEDPIAGVFDLIPNLLYFINADGVKSSVNNLLAPVNGIIEKLSPVVGDVSIGGLLEDAIGFDICDLTMDTVIELIESFGVVLNDEMKVILKTFYLGKLVEFDSANGLTAYRMAYTEDENAADFLTILLSFALDLFNINEELFSDLLGAETYTAVKTLIADTSDEFTYQTIDWGYMYEGEDLAARLIALEDAKGVLPERESDVYATYTKYTNNWNEATVDYLDSVLEDLADEIATMIAKEDTSLGNLVEGLLEDNVYSDAVLNSLLEMVVELLVDYEDIIVKAGALLGAEDLANWFDWCEVTTDENGETVVTCTKDWGIDEAEDKQTAFIDAFVEALQPADRLLNWLLFAGDYEFLEGTTNDVLITINGGEGYTYAIAPLFEALGVDMPLANELEDTDEAVAVIADAVTDLLDLYCDNTVDAVLNLVPNLIYFLNAGGVKAVVNNLLVPVTNLLDALEAFGLEVDLASLIEGFDITNITTEALLDMLVEELGVAIPAELREFIETFYIGKLESTGSGYKLVYTDEESRGDMITILLSIVLDVMVYEENAQVVSDLLGAETYDAIMDLLALTGAKEMQEYAWLYTDAADTDKVFNATNTSVRYESAYNNIWTRDKAEYIADNLVPFVSNILGLIGLEINGVEIRSVDDLLDSLLEGNLYTQEMADTILDLLKSIPDLFGEYAELGDMAINVVDKSLGTSIASWETMEVTVVDGDRDSFIAALEEMLAPVVPVLDVLLCGENISFFYGMDGKDVITVYGSEGYAYGIVPLFEALGCTMMTPAEFKELDNEAKIGALLESLLDRVDVILADPVNELFAMLPELIYFINSNGLDTAVKNVLNSIDTVIECLEPVLGAPDLMTLLGVELEEFNFEYLINMACEAIEDSTGLDVEPLIIDFAAELTMGKVVSYQSANGETYYKMVYAGENQFADMITILLRLIIDWLATGNNADAIIALIAGNSESEEAADSANTLIKFVLTAANTEPMTSGAMATLYYIFYGLNNGVAGLDYLYGNYGKSWDALVGFFEENDESYLDKAADVLKAILKEFAGIDTDSSVKDCDCNCHNNSGFIRFFFKLMNFFRRIFGMNQYQYCDCGAAHW